MERIGFIRRQDKLAKKVGFLESAKAGLERAQKRIFRATYCFGDYKSRPVILANADGGIFFQNRAATNLLKDRFVGVDLPGAVNLHNKKPQIVKISGDYYSLKLRKRDNRYEVTLERASKFYEKSTAPNLLNIPEFILQKKPQTI